MTEITTQTLRNADPNGDPPVEARERIDAPINATFKITGTKLYVPLYQQKMIIIFWNN